MVIRQQGGEGAIRMLVARVREVDECFFEADMPDRGTVGRSTCGSRARRVRAIGGHRKGRGYAVRAPVLARSAHVLAADVQVGAS